MRLEIKKGQKFNNLTVIREVDAYKLPSGQKNRAILCVCDCGTEKIVRLLHLTRGRTKSCGCLSKTKNGLSSHPLYKVWQAILLRTSGRYNDVYKRKNIKCCSEWYDFETFYHWSIDNGYNSGLQIDRINNDGGYSPINCRWVTPTENANNKDNTTKVFYKGKEYAFMDLCRIKKIKCDTTIRNRIKRGWTVEEAFDKKVRRLRNENNGN